MERLFLDIQGMSCGHCVARVTKALSALEGVQVEDVRVGSAEVLYDPARTSPETIRQAIDDVGYEARRVA